MLSTESLLSKFSFNYMSKQGILTGGSNDWIGNIWLKHADKIYKQCSFRAQDSESAKDLFQDVALKFCKKVHDLKLDVPLEGWFSSVIRTTFYDRIRKQRLEMPMSNLMDERGEYSAFPETASVHYTNDVREQHIQDAVEVLLQNLSPGEKMLVEGTYFSGMTIAEMSRDFGVSRCILWRKRNDALEKMKKVGECSGPSLKSWICLQ